MSCLPIVGLTLLLSFSKIKLFSFYFSDMEQQCHICGVRFPNRNTLIIHMKLHTNPDAHTCQNCQQVFPSYHGLNAHMRIHRRIFSCTICNQHFDRRSSLVSHLMRRHPDHVLIIVNGFIYYYHLL